MIADRRRRKENLSELNKVYREEKSGDVHYKRRNCCPLNRIGWIQFTELQNINVGNVSTAFS